MGDETLLTGDEQIRCGETLETQNADEAGTRAPSFPAALNRGEIETFRRASMPQELEGGIDFYEEVQRFEEALIRRALELTQGHQSRAARMLNLKITTLNSIIKRYGIDVRDTATGEEADTASRRAETLAPEDSPHGAPELITGWHTRAA